MLQRIKNRLRTFRSNIYGIYCPDCVRIDNKPTAHLHLMKDMFYIKCGKCSNTTPAGSIDMVIENWDDLFISRELLAIGIIEDDDDD